MNPYKDLFISYGRRESLGFVGRLHQQLKLAGYDAWFDKVNIPDGEDYTARINYGIESAHNFVYVMAPRCLTSPYCLFELEYARWLGKRVIPINQIVIHQTTAQALPNADKQVLIHFYQSYGLPDQHINTTQDVLNRSHALIGTTDWLDAKEQMSDEDCEALRQWAQSYENFWHRHDDLSYLQSVELPQFGHAIDTLTSVVERIQLVLERHNNYVHQHTALLQEALTWQKNQQATHYLLVGKERLQAQDWLLTQFVAGEQAPCVPNDLVCEFICEARKNSENLMTDAFICYDEADKVVRNRIVRELSRYAITTWRHDTDIPKGDQYEQAIMRGIEGADNLLYFLSPHSVQSHYCHKELDHALQYHKRIIPLLITATPTAAIPEAIQKLQYFDFTKDLSNLSALLQLLDHNKEYYYQHKALLVRAIKWFAESYKPSFLLQGHNLANALLWFRLNQDRELYSPTDLHQSLIQASAAAKGQLGTEVFISYSRKDGDFARKLNLALQEAGKTTWFDQESIGSGVDFEQEIFKGIEGADNFVFVISPDAIQSPYCEREVNYAAEHCKRFIPVRYRETDPQTMPLKLRSIQWIDFTTFDKALPELIQAIELDRAHVHQHTILQQRATEWEKNQRGQDFLLNNSACDNAENWLNTALAGSKNPPPTPTQQAFIQASRKNITILERKEKQRVTILKTLLSWSVIGLLIAIAIGVYAYLKSQEAESVLIDSMRKHISVAHLVYHNKIDDIHNQAQTLAYEPALAALVRVRAEKKLALYLENYLVQTAIHHILIVNRTGHILGQASQLETTPKIYNLIDNLLLQTTLTEAKSLAGTEVIPTEVKEHLAIMTTTPIIEKSQFSKTGYVVGAVVGLYFLEQGEVIDEIHQLLQALIAIFVAGHAIGYAPNDMEPHIQPDLYQQLMTDLSAAEDFDFGKILSEYKTIYDNRGSPIAVLSVSIPTSSALTKNKVLFSVLLVSIAIVSILLIRILFRYYFGKLQKIPKITDEELKDVIAHLATTHQETEHQIRKLRESQQETEQQLKRYVQGVNNQLKNLVVK